jgi:RNA polymerase sigma-70 factor (ECF subfamily)
VTPHSDAADWQSAIAGEGEAFGRIFDRHRDRVYRHSYRLVTTWADADDAVAITFSEAWRKRDRVRFVDDSLLPWLLVTATNVSRNLSRSARRYRALLDRLPPENHSGDHAELFDEGAAQYALRELSLSDQRVITLCVLEGMPERDAAAVLGVPPGTVKSRLSRAKARLASRLPHPTGLKEVTNETE